MLYDNYALWSWLFLVVMATTGKFVVVTTLNKRIATSTNTVLFRRIIFFSCKLAPKAWSGITDQLLPKSQSLIYCRHRSRIKVRTDAVAHRLVTNIYQFWCFRSQHKRGCWRFTWRARPPREERSPQNHETGIVLLWRSPAHSHGKETRYEWHCPRWKATWSKGSLFFIVHYVS